MTLELTPGMHHSGATGLGTGWWPSLGHGAGYRLMAPQGQRVLAPRGDLSLAWWSLVTRALWPQSCFMTPLGSPKRFVDEMSHQVGFVPLGLALQDGHSATVQPVRAHSQALVEPCAAAKSHCGACQGGPRSGSAATFAAAAAWETRWSEGTLEVTPR